MFVTFCETCEFATFMLFPCLLLHYSSEVIFLTLLYTATHFTGDPFEDIDGPQLQIFLGTTLGIVGSLMTVVTICLVLVWKREHLPKIQVDEPESNKPIQLEEQNGRLLTCSGEEESEIEEEI